MRLKRPWFWVLVIVGCSLAIAAVVARREGRRRNEALLDPPEPIVYAPTSDAALVRVKLDMRDSEIELEVPPGTRIEPWFVRAQLREWDGGPIHLRPNRDAP